MEGRSTDRVDATDATNSRPRVTDYVSVACQNCQKAKRKCDEGNPCQACSTRNLQCTFDQSKDGRRGRKRALNQLHTKAEALEMLLDSLKSSDDSTLEDLLLLIRNDVPLDEIIEHLRIVARKNEVRSRFRARVRRTILDISTLIDEPPIRVSAKPWTTVIDDDNAVSHLMSIYFTWQHYGYPSVDQDIFVKEMNLKDLSSQFCSPLLVNAMLAIACVYTDHPSAFADPENPSTRALHFLDEATRLWALAQPQATLPTLQALPPLISCNVAMGRDRPGFLYTSQSTGLVAEFAAEVKKGLKRGQQHYETTAFRQSYMLALWALFLIQTEFAVAWAKPFDIRKPSKKYPYTPEELQLTKTWCPYPLTRPEIPYCPNIFVTETHRLYEIAAELHPLVASGGPQDSPLPGCLYLSSEAKLEGLREVEKRLLGWQRDLPPEAQIGDVDNSVPTEPLTNLHLAYNSFHISTATQVLRVDGVAQNTKDEATERVLGACQEIARIFEWRQRTTGLLHFGIYTAHAASMCAYGLLDHLARPDIPDVFHTTIVVLSATCHRWFLARGIVKMLWIELQQRKLTSHLEPSTLSLLKLSAVDNWSSEDHELVKKCAYPNYAAVKERGVVLSEMGDLIDEYSRLNLLDDSREEVP